MAPRHSTEELCREASEKLSIYHSTVHPGTPQCEDYNNGASELKATSHNAIEDLKPPIDYQSLYQRSPGDAPPPYSAVVETALQLTLEREDLVSSFRVPLPHLLLLEMPCWEGYISLSIQHLNHADLYLSCVTKTSSPFLMLLPLPLCHRPCKPNTVTPKQYPHAVPLLPLPNTFLVTRIQCQIPCFMPIRLPHPMLQELQLHLFR